VTLTAGLNHIALLTSDLDRLIGFYVSVFDAKVTFDLGEPEQNLRHAMIDLGRGAALHPFEIVDSPHAAGLPGMFERGHLDHIAVNATDRDAFEELRRRLVRAGVSDGAITDFGAVCTVSFEDPDGCYGEVALWREGSLLTFDQRRLYPYPTALPYGA
jgi:catechol 2,3-dioxygenase-like lactoylglutathione lyase family enzyme